MVKWYFARDDETFGPFSATQLKEEAASDRLRPVDLVWKEGMETGVSASKVKHLFAIPASAAIAVATLPPEAEEDAEDTPPEQDLAPLEREPARQEPPPAQREAPGLSSGGRSVPASSKPPPPPARPARVMSVKGGVLISQDGERVRYRKTCVKCGHGDPGITTTPIQRGTVRTNFFCPKCRRSYPVEILSVG